MHSTMLLLLFVLFVDGVSGADPDETLTVMEGDSVTLHTDLTEILNDDTIVWTFGSKGSFISQITRKDNFTSLGYTDDVGFRGRLQVDQNTGSLIIRNTSERHSGQYQVAISRGKTTTKTFNVTVQQPVLSSGGKAGIVVAVLLVLAAAAAAAGFIYHRHKISELQKQILTVTVTRTEGDDVILKPNKTIQKGDGILWIFGDEEQQTSIAKFIGETGEFVTHDYAADGRFKGRLDLDTTGSLIIRNSRTTHSGLYTLYITSSSGDSEQRFIVTVRENEDYISVEEGGTVTLNCNFETLDDDLMLWTFGDQDRLIAEIRVKTGEICDEGVADGRFRGRLKLEKTGSLTITNIKAEHTGLYKLQIISSNRDTLYMKFRVSIPLSRVSVIEGESVRLSTDRPEIERDDEIQWMCGDEIIAEIKEGTGKTHDGPDERFRDRLQLDKITGDLTIKSFTDEDDGDYNLKIISSKGNTDKAYCVFITGRYVYVTEGESVHLPTDHPEIERDDEIQWRCGDEIIAEIKEETEESHYGPDERFRDRLQLNKRTGDLTINDSTDEDEGRYKLKIISRKVNKNKTYRVGVTARNVPVTAGESVRLSTDRPEIERDDVIQWRCGDEIIAEIKGGTRKTHDERFRDRLQLNKRTGDLTIKNSTAEHEGYYKLKIRSSKGNTNRTYCVTIRYKPREKSPVKGNIGKRVDESAVEMQPLMTLKSSLWRERAEEEEFSLTTQAPPPPVNHSVIIRSSYNTSPASSCQSL